MCKKQQKWKWLDASAGELSHQRESPNHLSPPPVENLNSVRVWENARAYVHMNSSSRIDFSERMTSICHNRRMPQLLLFHLQTMRACNPVGMSSIAQCITRATGWFFLCARGVGATCPMPRSHRTGDVTPAGRPTLCYAAKHTIISILTEDKEAGQYQVYFISLRTRVRALFFCLHRMRVRPFVLPECVNIVLTEISSELPVKVAWPQIIFQSCWRHII